jgi:flagellar biosynthetic protein FliR
VTIGQSLAAGLVTYGFDGALLFCRIGGVIMLLPGFGEQSVPPMLRAGLVLSLVLVLAPVLAPILPAPPATPILLAALWLHEIAIGLFIGWLARVAAMALPMAGQFISYQIGLSSVVLPDALLGAESTVLSSAFGLAMPTLFLTSNLFVWPLMALAQSYRTLPAQGALSLHNAAGLMLGAVASSFAIALELAAPYILAGLLWQAALALISRLVPQIQVYFVAMPAQILGGSLLLAAGILSLLMLWQHQMQSQLAYLFGS